MTIDEDTRVDANTAMREQAIKRLKKRRDFHGHLLVYTLVNSSLVIVWLVTGRHGFFWPVFFIAFWGVGLVMNAWDVYHGEEFSEDQIQQEMRRSST